MSAKKKDPARYSEIRNSKALRDYFVDERFEAGIHAGKGVDALLGNDLGHGAALRAGIPPRSKPFIFNYA